jgi:hypothetical protein
VKRKPSQLSPEWRFLAYALQPSQGEVASMLGSLDRVFGSRNLCSLLGVSKRTLASWLERRFYPSAAAVRCIWFLHCLALRSERLQSLFDILTWGRFRVERRTVLKPGCEWSDWSI